MWNPDLIVLIEERGWPFTKAAYVSAMFWPLAPDFPLDGDVIGQVPQDLPGKLPNSPRDLFVRTMTPSTKPDTDHETAPLPEPLIESVMRRHELTRQKAIEQIRAHGG